METEFSQLVRRYMKRRGVRRGDMVSAMGLHHKSRGRKQLSRWLNGTAVPSVDEAESLAALLRIPMRHVRAALAADGEDHVSSHGDALSRTVPELSLYMGRGVEWPVSLPEGLSLEHTLLLARARAKSVGARARLKMSGGVTYLIDEQGHLIAEDRPIAPRM